MFPSYRNQSVDLQSNFYMMGTLAVKGLREMIKKKKGDGQTDASNEQRVTSNVQKVTSKN